MVTEGELARSPRYQEIQLRRLKGVHVLGVAVLRLADYEGPHRTDLLPSFRGVSLHGLAMMVAAGFPRGLSNMATWLVKVDSCGAPPQGPGDRDGRIYASAHLRSSEISTIGQMKVTSPTKTVIGSE